MEQAAVKFGQLAATSKHFARLVLTAGENRLELLMVEVQQERERLLSALFLAIGVAAFGFFAGIALAMTLVVVLWDIAPVAALLAVGSLAAGISIFLYRRLSVLRRDWKSLPATFDQFRKDCECLERKLD
jgi:uncharacterized membrane protein YqjE